MEDLLPHYERELAFLRTRSADFARQYPKIAGRLQLSGDAGDDPHVERLIQSFALLASAYTSVWMTTSPCSPSRCWRCFTRTTCGPSRPARSLAWTWVLRPGR